MGKTLREKIQQLPLEQQKAIKERSAELIAEEMIRQQRKTCTQTYSRADSRTSSNRSRECFSTRTTY
ncbi:hypothetical protein [Scytonema sp. NUACC26]|uniref:hypothetical protein n=1 Tax=Scytonema sp. NUACC26 TaxID=3140176 RepID=UPI0038B24AF0